MELWSVLNSSFKKPYTAYMTVEKQLIFLILRMAPLSVLRTLAIHYGPFLAGITSYNIQCVSRCCMMLVSVFDQLSVGLLCRGFQLKSAVVYVIDQ